MRADPPEWVAAKQRRFMRPNAHLYMRPDWKRFQKPSHRPAPESPRPAFDPASLCALTHALDELRAALGELRVERAWRAAQQAYERAYGRKYNPNQPRVPAGSPQGGQWTRDGGIRLVANEPKLPIGPAAFAHILGTVAKRLIENYRKENPGDLFGSSVGTVSVTEIDGKHIFGSNSTSPY